MASIDRPIVFAITGASGAAYAVRLLEQLIAARRRVQLVISSHGLRLLETEVGLRSADALRDRVGASGWNDLVTVFDDADRGAAPASGSALNAGMVICPCSMGTLSAISAGASRSLVERAADVAGVKDEFHAFERRKDIRPNEPVCIRDEADEMHRLGRQRRRDTGASSPQRRISVCSTPSWSRIRATTKSIRSSIDVGR